MKHVSPEMDFLWIYAHICAKLSKSFPCAWDSHN